MTFDNTTGYVTQNFTLYQVLGQGLGHVCELALYYDAPVPHMADGTVPMSDPEFEPGSFVEARTWIDWGDGTYTWADNFAVSLIQLSTGTIVDRLGDSKPVLLSHVYRDAGTYTVTLVGTWRSDTPAYDGGAPDFRPGSSRNTLTTFTTGEPSGPFVTDEPRDRLVALCQNLNDGRDAGSFYDCSFLASAPFSDLRAAGPCAMGPGFHGLGARPPWGTTVGSYFGLGFLGAGAVERDIWLQVYRASSIGGGYLTPEEETLWPNPDRYFYTRMIDGGPDKEFGDRDASDESNPMTIPGGWAAEYDRGVFRKHRSSDSTIVGDLIDVASTEALRPDWMEHPSFTSSPTPYPFVVIKPLTDTQLLMRANGSLGDRHYIVDLDAGTLQPILDEGCDLTAFGFLPNFWTRYHDGSTGWVYGNPFTQSFSTVRTSDGRLHGSALANTAGLPTPYSNQAILLAVEANGVPVGMVSTPASTGSLESFDIDFPTISYSPYAFTGLPDPIDTDVVYIPVQGYVDLDAGQLAMAIYRVRYGDLSSAVRVAWLQHPYSQAIDTDGSQWNAWDYIDTLMYGNPLDGDWLPPGPASITVGGWQVGSVAW